MTPFALPLDLAELIGVLGFVLYVSAYSMLTLRVLSTKSVSYFILNLTAASCVLIGLTASFNLASALIQLFWVVMSLIGITLHILRPMKAQPATVLSETRSGAAYNVNA
ncbi:MAG: hypothetical protein AB8B60_10495 [Sulfitobacter sp.]